MSLKSGAKITHREHPGPLGPDAAACSDQADRVLVISVQAHPPLKRITGHVERGSGAPFHCFCPPKGSRPELPHLNPPLWFGSLGDS